jgi:protein-L-isoaspartate(D-aspartate) O-methyltransferase
MKLVDDFRHKGQRQRLMAQLRAKFNFDERVLEAMNNVPRHFFLDKGMELNLAYQNKPAPIGAGQTISHPFTVAMQTHLLAIQRWEKVLEIGTGCGYQTAVLAELGARVYSIERQRELFDKTQQLLTAMHYEVSLFYGDGYAGKPTLAPFHKIIVTCGAPEIPQQLLQQLAIGGRMVVPVGEASQTMIVIVRHAENEFETTEHGNYNFVPMLEGTEKAT